MSHPIRFVLAVHNHQPVGNLEDVVERAYQDCYLPFLRTFSRYPALRMSLHTSGSLLDWLETHHPEYVDALAELASEGRIEILGGAYYEPILPMVPRADRRGQIRSFSDKLEQRFGHAPLGMWLPERVWEPSLAADLGAAGIEHTVLDDFHFKHVGLADSQLHGYYLTEDDGQLVAIFPGNERLRYLMPFAPPEETIEYLREVAQAHPGAVVVFGDDGEKFGHWPGMKQHVFEQGWLTRFFDLLSANSDWLRVTTLAEAVNHVKPQGKLYLPEASYREMIEWASLEAWELSADRLAAAAEAAIAPAAPAPHASWRNFKVKYPEANEMYARMLMVSKRLEAAARAGHSPELVEEARRELYRGQCNCAYWHGSFGGIYLAHLRQAVYRHLIAAETLLDRAAGRGATWAGASVRDFNLDVHKEVFLANDKLAAYAAPECGGQLYELDVRSVGCNLLATLARRPEPYHAQLSPPALLDYDRHARRSLVDHFHAATASPDDVAAGRAVELGDFVAGRYEFQVRREPDRVRLQMARRGTAAGHEITVVKTLTLVEGSHSLDVEYQLHGLPVDEELHFGIEFNFSGLPTDRADRAFHDGQQASLGHLGERLVLANRKALHLSDHALGLDVGLKMSKAGQIVTFPIETVSRYERGIERLHQSVVVMPRWTVAGDTKGLWSVNLRLALDTSAADSRHGHSPLRAPHADFSGKPKRRRTRAA